MKRQPGYGTFPKVFHEGLNDYESKKALKITKVRGVGGAGGGGMMN
jgi:hypothetical protein